MSVFADAKFDFVGKRRIAAVISLVLIAAGLASLGLKGGPKYSIDFTGGSLIQVQFAEDGMELELPG